MVAVFNLRMDIRWMGKHTLFPPLLGRIMLWFGGIPVNRTKAYNMVGKMVTMLEENPQTILCIPPEGTRGKVTQWKTGFYRIAEKAGVPILMAAIDAENKQLRVIGEFKPTGDLDQDMMAIRKQYQEFKGINPENTSTS
jgi:1-acyl-sn-glycerol-3-phosphate acyltransferase